MQSKAATVDEYVNEIPEDRRAAIQTLRETINANLPEGYVEGMLYGMIAWYVPLERYPDTYNGQPIGIAGLASQKNYMALYLYGPYSNPAIGTWFKTAFKKAGKKLDMGKSCVRFKKLEDLPLDVIGETITKVPVDKLIATAEKDYPRQPAAKKKPAARKQPAAKKKSAAKKKKSTKKKSR